MATVSKAKAQIRARIARKSQSCPPNDPELHALRRDLAVEGLAEHAQRVVAGWPAPTEEQLARVAAILRAGNSAPRPAPDGRKGAVERKLAELDSGAA